MKIEEKILSQIKKIRVILDEIGRDAESFKKSPEYKRLLRVSKKGELPNLNWLENFVLTFCKKEST